MIRNNLLIFLAIILLNNVCKPQFENIEIGAKPISLGGAFTSLADNSDATYYNPSGISQQLFREISIFYSPAPFGLKDLSYGALTYAEPTNYGAFGLSIKTYGFNLYREIQATFTYANNYKKKVFFGFNFNYYNLKIQNYGSASTIGIDIGGLAYLTDYLRWGFLVNNLTRAKIGQTKEKIPQIYRMGLSLQARKDLNILLEAEKDTRYNYSIKGGLEYNLLDYVDLRAGVSSEPTKFAAGVGFNYSMFRIEYAMYTHPDLGVTHQGTITINFGGYEGRRKMRESIVSAFDSPKKIDTVVQKKTKPKKLKKGETVNINTADVSELMKIPYVGEKMANDIIEYRTKNNGFKSADELINIKGIKEKKLEKIRPFIRLE
jgi:competence ComEA-like helix-hairpin-helix protein